jgi:prepilin-type processing-associated H-X9-DG protein
MAASCQASLLPAEQEKRTAVFRGRPLEHWVAQAMAERGPNDLEETVAALIEAVTSDDPNAKRDAGDALAALGPKAKAALPALLAEFGHEYPWVRVSCQAAVASMGKEAVPALIETFENNTGGPRIRAAFVLGGIGADAKPAVPVILRVMKEEPPVMQDRLAGVLRQIDPQRFPARAGTGKARFEGTSSQLLPEVATTDWPQFHGPARDGICRDKGLLQAWPEGGPKQIWTLEGLGRGYSTVSIANGKLFTMGDRMDSDGDEAQFVIAFDLETRKELWSAQVGPAHRDGGPRCTPTVDGQSLYAIGTEGDLVCLDAVSGQLRWARNFVNDFDGKFMAIWKFSESPLVDGNRLICTPGGPEVMMVALNKNTGEVIWKCATPDLGEKGVDGCGYSSAIIAEICDVRQYVQLVGRGVIGVEAATGRFLWGYNGVANTVANITRPIAHGDYVFATTAYNTGSALLKISRDGDALKAEEVYFIESRDFQNHHGGVVLMNGYIYGGHGPNRGDPACIELATGKVVWRQRAPARGSAGVLYADGHVIFRYDRGDVVLIEASPEAMKVKGRFQAPDEEGPAWAHPVIHQGKLYLRHADSLFCYDLRSE